jgi:hypothetical protein
LLLQLNKAFSPVTLLTSQEDHNLYFHFWKILYTPLQESKNFNK